jgi:hypothetical protein
MVCIMWSPSVFSDKSQRKHAPDPLHWIAPTSPLSRGSWCFVRVSTPLMVRGSALTATKALSNAAHSQAQERQSTSWHACILSGRSHCSCSPPA